MGVPGCFGACFGKRCSPLLTHPATNWRGVLWRAIAPLMKPWCAEGDVPTASNLNLYRGRSSYVGWHSDDEPLFGERRGTKLIVSVSFGTHALFKWKGKSCPCNEGNSCWLGMVMFLSWMANARTSFFIARILVRIRNGLTSRSVGSSNMSPPFPSMLFANVCAFFFSVPGAKLVRKGVVWLFGFSLVPSASWVHLLC